jgi:hypothetical protein
MLYRVPLEFAVAHFAEVRDLRPVALEETVPMVRRGEQWGPRRFAEGSNLTLADVPLANAGAAGM